VWLSEVLKFGRRVVFAGRVASLRIVVFSAFQTKTSGSRAAVSRSRLARVDYGVMAVWVTWSIGAGRLCRPLHLEPAECAHGGSGGKGSIAS